MSLNRLHGLSCSVEFSVPRFGSGTNLFSSPVAEVHSAVEATYEELSPTIPWDVPVAGLTVTRIDTVREFFDVADIPGLLLGLQLLPRRRRRKYNVWGSGSEGPETLTIQPAKGTDWRSSLYDKAKERLAKAATVRDPEVRGWLQKEARVMAGTLRFEAQARSKVLRRRGIQTVEHLSEEALASLNRYLFELAEFHQPTAGRLNKLKQQAQAATDPKEARELHHARAHVLDQYLGLEPLSRETQRKYRGIARKYGLTTADFSPIEQPVRRLDYDSGSVVVSHP